MEPCREILLGLVAYRANYIDSDQFIEVCQRWHVRPERSLPDVLIESGLLKAADLPALEHIASHNLSKQVNACSAAATLLDRPLRMALGRVPEAEFQRWVATVLPGPIGVEEQSADRRHWTSLGAAAAILLVVITAGTGFLAVVTFAVQDSQRYAEMACAEAALASLKADQARAEARSEAERAELVRQSVEDLVAHVGELPLRKQQGAAERQLLHEALAYYQELFHNPGDLSADQWRPLRPQIALRVGAILTQLNRPIVAGKAYQEGIDLVRTQPDSAENKSLTISLYKGLASSLRGSGDLEGAEQFDRRAQEIQQKTR